jgi:hypothetical protein
MLIDTLHVTGGHTKNPLLMELYADATGCTVIEPLADEAVLLGTGMVAATAAGLFPDLNAACLAMQQGGKTRAANPADRRRLRSRLPDLPGDAPAAAGTRRPGSSPGVPAHMAARAAEWSLGDEVAIVASAGDVSFARRQAG